MMKTITDIKNALDRFECIKRSSCDFPIKIKGSDEVIKAGWVKFEIEKNESGWRTLEFLAWVINDLMRAGEEIHFFPTSPPPYLNTPGKCLSFVMEFYPENEGQDVNFTRISDFILRCYKDYWPDCKK